MNIVEPTPLQIAVFAINLGKSDENVDNIAEAIKDYGRKLLHHAACECVHHEDHKNNS